MAISIAAKQDYSMLFNNLPTSSGSTTSTSSFLSDYASIKNGSYGKLMKAYYGKNSSNVSGIVEKNTAKDTDKAISTVKDSATALSESAGALLTTGSKSVFATDEKGAYDTDAIYKAVSQFVDDYNSTLDAAANSSNTSITNTAVNMIGSSLSNYKMLNSMGITVGSNNKLSIDEETFKKADMSKAKTLFNGTGSYAYGIKTKASMISATADRLSKQTSGVYNSRASYASNYSTGNIYSSFF